MKQAGVEKGFESYIKTLQEQADTIKIKSGLSDDQIKQYENLVEKEKDINSKISNLEEDKKTIKNLNTSLSSQVDSLRATADEYEAYLNDADIKAKFKVELKIIDSFKPSVRSATANLVTIIDSKIKVHNVELATIKAGLAPLLAKVKVQAELQEKPDAIKKEQQKLNEIAIKTNNLKTKKTSYKKKADGIIDSYKQVVAKYENLRNEFKKFESKFGEITLGVHVSFNDDVFNGA